MKILVKSYFIIWKKAFKFHGKSNRKEYWFFQLIFFFWYVLWLILNVLQNLLQNLAYTELSQNSYILNVSQNYDISYMLTEIFLIISQTISILSLIPLMILMGSLWVNLPLTVRRIRDVGMSWQWIFFVCIPIFGYLFVLIFLTRTSIETINGTYYFRKY